MPSQSMRGTVASCGEHEIAFFEEGAAQPVVVSAPCRSLPDVAGEVCVTVSWRRRDDAPNATAERISKLLDESGTTRSALAAAIGASKSSVTRWLDGSRTPRAEALKKIADFFDVPVGDLL